MSDIYKSLPDMELIEYLEHLCNFGVTPDMIKNPSPGFIRAILQEFLKHCLLNVDAMDVMPWNHGELVVEHKELYEDMSMVVFFTVVKKFMMTAGFPDFGIKDLLEPKPKRTRKVLTLLVSFWKYNLSMMDKYMEVESELQGEIDEKKSVQKEIEKLNKDYANLLTTKVDPKEKEKQVKMKELSRLHEAQEASNLINDEYKILKTNIATEEQRSSELELSIITEKENCEELDNRILRSPIRYTSDIEDLKNKVQELDEMIVEMSKKRKLKKQESEIFITCMENFSKFEEICNELMDITNTLTKEASTIDEIQQVIDELSLKMNTLNAQLNRIGENMNLLEQRWAQGELQTKMQLEGQKKILEVNRCGQVKECKLIEWHGSSTSEMEQGLAALVKKQDDVAKQIEEISKKIKHKFVQRQKDLENCMQQYTSAVKLATDVIKQASL